MKKHRDVAIELTPLLDVILILLFLILSGSQETNKKVKQEADTKVESMQETVDNLDTQLSEFKTKVDSLSMDNSKLTSMVEGFKGFGEFAKIIDIMIRYPAEREDVSGRQLLIDDNGKWITVEYDKNSLVYGYDTTKSYLKEILEKVKDAPVFIVFSYDDKTKTRDVTEISELISSLAETSPDIYFKTKNITADKQ